MCVFIAKSMSDSDGTFADTPFNVYIMFNMYGRHHQKAHTAHATQIKSLPACCKRRTSYCRHCTMIVRRRQCSDTRVSGGRHLRRMFGYRGKALPIRPILNWNPLHQGSRDFLAGTSSPRVPFWVVKAARRKCLRINVSGQDLRRILTLLDCVFGIKLRATKTSKAIHPLEGDGKKQGSNRLVG